MKGFWTMVVVALAMALGAAALEAMAAEPFAPTRFTVVEEGTVGKPDMVLIPGLASSRAVWAAEAAKLAPAYRLHLVQINGFAGQPPGPNAQGELLPAIVEELDRYMETRGMHAVVMGHSLGGLLGLMLAEAHPGDVRRLIVVDALPFYGVLLGSDATAESIRPRAEKMRAMLLAQGPEARAAGAKATANFLVNDAAGQKQVEADSEASDARVSATALFEDMQTDLRGRVAGIKTPTLMVYPIDAAAGMTAERVDAVYKGAYAAMPHVTLVRIEDSRHFIQYDQPAKLDEAVRAFLQ